MEAAKAYGVIGSKWRSKVNVKWFMKSSMSFVCVDAR